MDHLKHSKHASVRAQQRSVPRLIEEWLDEFGAEHYDGHGGVIRYFNKKSVRKLEQAKGARIVRLLSRYLDVYKIESTADGTTITLGHRTVRLRRR